jgi:hypothetical protein
VGVRFSRDESIIFGNPDIGGSEVDIKTVVANLPDGKECTVSKGWKDRGLTCSKRRL